MIDSTNFTEVELTDEQLEAVSGGYDPHQHHDDYHGHRRRHRHHRHGHWNRWHHWIWDEDEWEWY